MEQTMFYKNTTKPMSRCYYNPPPMGQSQEIVFKELSYEQKGSSYSSQEDNPSPDFINKASVNEEYDMEDEESEFKMGRLIRQASLNSTHMSTKVMKGSTSLPRYLSQKPETNQEKVSTMRKYESMKERKRNKNSMKMGKNNSGAPTIPGGWVDKGSSEDMKEQIKFWARAVAFNLHQDC